MVDTLVDDGKLKRGIDIPLPVEGLLNPALAHQFDDFCDKNSAYSLTLATIATSLDKDFPTLHPKQLRRFVLGPFYHSEITVNGAVVDKVLQKVKRPENQWMLTWTLQEIYSMNEKPGKRGLWSSQPPQEEFFINTDNLEAARMGVSDYCEACAGAARGLSGDLCRGAGGDDLRRLRDAHHFGRQGSAEDLNRWTSD